MIKLVSLAAIAGVAAGAENGLPKISGSRKQDGLTTEDLQKATRQFIEQNAGKIQPKKNGASVPSSGGKTQRKLNDHKALRSPSTRERRSGKGGRSGSGSGSGKSGKGPRNYRSGKGGKWWGGSGRSGSGKSGKWNGGGDHGDDDDWGHEELFYLLPTACPNECISSDVTAEHEMINSLKQCKEDAGNQMWLVRSDGSYIMIESHDEPGKCIAVDYEHGDDQEMMVNTCYNGELMLKDCESEYGAEWYFTGGQLVNTLCWSSGLSSMMTVFLEEENNVDMQACLKDVAVWGANDEAILKADTFMFVDRLPMAPMHMTVEEINDKVELRAALPSVTDPVEGNA